MPAPTIPQTYIPSDSLILGLNQLHSGSELQAGARAILAPSPLTQALSSLRGRVVAQTMLHMISHRGSLNFTRYRVHFLKEVMLRALSPNVLSPLIVCPSVGFSPLSIWLAEALPQSSVIEIDIASVIRNRHSRLRNAGITLPSNLHSIVADLSQVPLNEVIDNLKIDLIHFLAAYYTPDQQRSALNYISSILAKDGACVCYFPWQPALIEIEAASRFFKKQIGDTPGKLRDEAQIPGLFEAASYRTVEIVYPSQWAGQLGINGPVLDVEILTIARK